MRNFIISGSLFLWLVAPIISIAAEGLFVPLGEEPATRSENGLVDKVRWRIQLTDGIAQRLEDGKILELILPDRRLESVLVKTLPGTGLLNLPNIQETLVGRFEGIQGGIEIYLEHGSIRGMLVNDVDTGRMFKAEFDFAGKGALQELDPNQYYCVDYPLVTQSSTKQRAEALNIAAPPPDIATLLKLQSRPGAPNIIYINYVGGTEQGSQWTDQYTNGAPIHYTAYDSDKDPSTFSEKEVREMWLGWAETAEDYAPFDVNVTTDPDVYQSVSSRNRMQVIATTTKYWYQPSAGGLAWIATFGKRDDDYSTTAWVWNTGDEAMGMTLSHESGHTMGLEHDGNPGEEYEGGHGNWGPIMGGPFSKSFVQWSKGEYSGANNQQDDLDIIRKVLQTVVDDAGDDIDSATQVNLPLTDHQGLITPKGLAPDVDVYSFSLPADSSIIMEIGAPLGVMGEKMGTNLSLSGQLKNAAGKVVASITPTEQPADNVLKTLHPLLAGDYHLFIQAKSYDSSWTTGFGEYGNGGYYKIELQEHTGPDLAVTALEIKNEGGDPGVFSPWETINTNTHVTNAGTGSSPASILEYFLVMDQSFDPAIDKPSAETTPIPELGALQTTSLEQALSPLVPAALGHRWLYACADSVPGGYPGNNCSEGREIVLANSVLCHAAETKTTLHDGKYESIDFLKSRGSLALENARVYSGQYQAELYIQAPEVSLGINNSSFSVASGEVLSVRSSKPLDCK